MAVEGFLETHNPELAASLRRVQGRGGRANQVFARRRGVFVAILNFLAGWLAGRGQGSSRRQLARRRERVRRRLEELGPSSLPERGDNVIEWSSESDVSEASEPKARSRSPAASPSSSLLVVRPKARPKTAAGSLETEPRVEGDSIELRGVPVPPAARPKGPTGVRTPKPPIPVRNVTGSATASSGASAVARPTSAPLSGHTATSSVPPSAPSVPDSPGVSAGSGPTSVRPKEPGYPPPARDTAPRAEGTVVHLSFPARHYWDLHDFATQLFGNVARGTPKLWVVSFDWHGVWDTISLDEGRQLIRRLGERTDTVPLWCSYASEDSPHRPNTLQAVRQLARYLGATLAVAHTNAKSTGEGAKHKLLLELLRIAGSQLHDTDVRILHIDDSRDIISAVNRLSEPISAVQWDGRKHPRWTLSETVFYYVGEEPQQ